MSGEPMPDPHRRRYAAQPIRAMPLHLRKDITSNLTDALRNGPFGSLLRTVGNVADRERLDVWLVGGAVRDILLKRTVPELDFVTVGPGSGIRLARALAKELGGRTVHVYKTYGTAAIRVPRAPGPGARGKFRGDKALSLEFVGARRESYRRESRKPVVEDGSLTDDLRRRDFTINAMAISVNPDRFGTLEDPFDGQADLQRGLLRTPLDPDVTFEDDPLRMIRAARFATRLRFRVDAQALEAMRRKTERITIVSRERITDELQKIVCAACPSIGFRILFETGLLKHILPRLAALQGVEAVDGLRHKDNFFHTLQVLDNLSAMTADRDGEETCYLRWAALLHDIGKPRSKRLSRDAGWTFHGHEEIGARMIPGVFKKLRLPAGEPVKYVQKLIRLHHRPVSLVDNEVTDSAVRRLLFEAGDDIDDLMTLVRADITSKNPQRVQRYLAAFDLVEEKMRRVEEKDRLRNFRPPVDGREIMKTLDIGESVAVGIVKETIREAILEGEIPNEHDAAFQLMMEIKDDALRNGALFEEFIAGLKGPENAAIGAIKEVVFSGNVPKDRAAAWRRLTDIKDHATERLRGKNGE